MIDPGPDQGYFLEDKEHLSVPLGEPPAATPTAATT
jgi:hypothetical protein